MASPIVKCPKCGDIYLGSHAVCPKCGETNAEYEPKDVMYCKKCDKEYPSNYARCPVCCEGLVRADGPNVSEKVSSAAESGHFNDEYFDTPNLARGFHLVTQIIVWLIGLGGVIGGCCTLSVISILVGVILIVLSVIFIWGGLIAARIVYELTIIFFEHLKVLRQIRDLLAKKNLDAR